MSRLALIRALEACEIGDHRLAVEILLVLLDELAEPPVQNRVHCSACGRGFAWPGLRDAHARACSRRTRWAAA